MRQRGPEGPSLAKATQTKPAGGAQRAGPRSVSRGLEVLRLVASSLPGLGLTEIATALKLPKSSVLNVLRSLQVAEFIALADGRYILGSEALSLAAAIGATVSFPSSLVPRLRELALAVNETVTLGVHSDDGLNLIYLEVMESNHQLRLIHTRGSVQPIHASSIGQATLSFMPEALLDNLLAQRTLPHLTANTITKAQLLQKIPEIRKDGVAVSIGGQDDDTMGAGAPVFEASGILRCAIAAGGPITRIQPRREEIIGLVKAAAADMSRMLGYQRAYPAPQPELKVGTPSAQRGRRKVAAR
jgi:IclR family transcriptional regulator, acetate operon repressor